MDDVHISRETGDANEHAACFSLISCRVLRKSMNLFVSCGDIYLLFLTLLAVTNSNNHCFKAVSSLLLTFGEMFVKAPFTYCTQSVAKKKVLNFCQNVSFMSSATLCVPKKSLLRAHHCLNAISFQLLTS